MKSVILHPVSEGEIPEKPENEGWEFIRRRVRERLAADPEFARKVAELQVSAQEPTDELLEQIRGGEFAAQAFREVYGISPENDGSR